MDLKFELAGLRERRRLIERDGDLSDEGKARQLAQLKSEQERLLDSAQIEYAAAMARLKKQSKGLDARRQEAEERAAAGWDFNRLVYCKGLVEATIARAQSLGQVAEAYNQAARSGDKHMRRAFSEYAPGLIGPRFGGDEAASRGDLLRRMSTDLDNLTTTEELRELRAEEAAFAGELVQLAEQIKAGSSAEGENPFMPNEFQKLLAGMQIDQRVDAETLTIHYAVELVD